MCRFFTVDFNQQSGSEKEGYEALTSEEKSVLPYIGSHFRRRDHQIGLSRFDPVRHHFISDLQKVDHPTEI